MHIAHGAMRCYADGASHACDFIIGKKYQESNKKELYDINEVSFKFYPSYTTFYNVLKQRVLQCNTLNIPESQYKYFQEIFLSAEL